jgi:hypothetical protein
LLQALQYFGQVIPFPDLACGVRFFPFSSAFLLALARGRQFA